MAGRFRRTVLLATTLMLFPALAPVSAQPENLAAHYDALWGEALRLIEASNDMAVRSGTLDDFLAYEYSRVDGRRIDSKALREEDAAYLRDWGSVRFLYLQECFYDYWLFDDDTLDIYHEIATGAGLQVALSWVGADPYFTRGELAAADEKRINKKLVALHRDGVITGDPFVIPTLLWCRGGASFGNIITIRFADDARYAIMVPDVGHRICVKLDIDPFSARCPYRREIRDGDDNLDLIGLWRYVLVYDGHRRENFINIPYSDTKTTTTLD